MSALSNLSSLNSATKYPSIETYHVLGGKGRLTDEVTPFEGDVYFTEKVDGTNGRIIVLPGGDYVIGSREHLLYARGDRIINPVQDIVPVLKPLADELTSTGALSVRSGARILFLEVYGGNIGGQAKQYSSKGALGYRIFDIADIADTPLGWEAEKISRWRESGGQNFAHVADLMSIADAAGIPTVPYIGRRSEGNAMPQTLQETYELLCQALPVTRSALDESGRGEPEGIVFRTADRSVIRKARRADYRRTLGIK